MLPDGPGWPFRRATSLIRVLPDYLIIGTERGGTTSLHSYLTQHPLVLSPRRKEIHFFDVYYGRGPRFDRTIFPSKSTVTRRARTLGHRPLVGEATPSYLQPLLVPERAAQLVRDARLIALLRNPVDRALSHYYRRRSHGGERLSTFEGALEAEESRWLAAMNNMADHGIGHINSCYLRLGIYVEGIRRWLEHYPKEQLLLIKSEDFSMRTRRPCTQWCRHSSGSRRGVRTVSERTG